MTILTLSQLTFVAARLEHAGFIEAAQWLRTQTPLREWEPDDEWLEALSRPRGGSVPPAHPAPQPIPVTPAPRPDQPIS